jgi:hypothetical protein
MTAYHASPLPGTRGAACLFLEASWVARRAVRLKWDFRVPPPEPRRSHDETPRSGYPSPAGFELPPPCRVPRLVLLLL